MSVFIAVILVVTVLAGARSALALRRSEPGLESAGHVNKILAATGLGLFFLGIGTGLLPLVGIALPFMIASVVRQRRLLARQGHELLEAVDRAENTIDLVEALEARRTFIDRVPLKRNMAWVAIKGGALFLIALFSAPLSGIGDVLFAILIVLMAVSVITDLVDIARQLSDRRDLDRAIDEALSAAPPSRAALEGGEPIL